MIVELGGPSKIWGLENISKKISGGALIRDLRVWKLIIQFFRTWIVLEEREF